MRPFELRCSRSQFGQVVLNEMVAAMGSRECCDIQRGDHSTGSASNRIRERTEARLELGLNKAPALFADRTDFIAQGGRIDDRPVRTAFEHRLLKPRLALHGVRCREQNAAHRGTVAGKRAADHQRSEEHTSDLPSLMRISYAVFCLQKK